MQKRLFLSQLLEQLFKFDLLDYFKVSKIPLCLFKISNEQNIFMYFKNPGFNELQFNAFLQFIGFAKNTPYSELARFTEL